MKRDKKRQKYRRHVSDLFRRPASTGDASRMFEKAVGKVGMSRHLNGVLAANATIQWKRRTLPNE